MLINSQKSTKNYLLLKKGGFRLFNTCNKRKSLSSNFEIHKITLSTCNPSKERPIINDTGKEETKKDNKKNEIINTFSNISYNKFNLTKYIPKIDEYKKRLYLKKIVSSEKDYLLENYMKHKEIEIIKNRNIKTVYDAKKNFFTDNRINDNRTSYFYKEKLFDDKKKFPLMIKDIQSNYILLKNKRYKKYKDYLLLKKIEAEKNNFKDFNEKLGIRNINIKSDKLIKKNNTYVNKNFNIINCVNNYLKTFSSTHKEAFSQNRKKYKI